MTLDDAQEIFYHEESKTSAADYLEELIKYYGDEMIGWSTVREGVEEIIMFLRQHEYSDE